MNNITAETMGHRTLAVDIAATSLIGSGTHVIAYATDILAQHNRFLIAKPEVIEKFWQWARNRDQTVVDWIFNTYSEIVEAIGGVHNLNKVLELYGQSLGLGNGSGGQSVIDEEFFSRLTSAKEAGDILTDNGWMIVILSLFAIDLDAIEVENEANEAGASNKP